MLRRLKERRARREVDELRERVLGHWKAVGIGEEWDSRRDAFFLSAARSKRGLE